MSRTGPQDVTIKQLYTVGYEGAELSAFLTTLCHLGIRQIIDVRELPLSRRRGFSKRALSEALQQKGISYTHLKELGDPKPGREAARRGDFAEFRRIYKQHLRKVSSQEALAVVADLAAKQRSCLLCYERDSVHCHRSIVSAALAEDWKFTVNHIGVRDNIGPKKNQVVQDRDRFRAYAVG